MANDKPRKLTQAWVNALKWEEKTGNRLIRDTEVRGLMVSLGKRGAVYKFQRDIPGTGRAGGRNKTFRTTVGPARQMTLPTARNEARKLTATILDGDDPRPPKPEPEDEDQSTWTVRQLVEWHLEEMEGRNAPRTVADARHILDRHLDDILDRPLCGPDRLRKLECRTLHRRLTGSIGKSWADKSLATVRAAFNRLCKIAEDEVEEALGGNPTRGVEWHGLQKRTDYAMTPEQIARWWRWQRALENPIRREMHALGLLGGFRPANVKRLEREWICLDEDLVRFPAEAMKSRRVFVAPLSAAMRGCVERALEIGDEKRPGTRWLFPSYSRRRRGVDAPVSEIKEKGSTGMTGYRLRHTYVSRARRLSVSEPIIDLLTAHKTAGVNDIYTGTSAVMDGLREAQELISAELMRSA